MAFEEWIQEDLVQRGVFSPLSDFIKLIFGNPNKPFKKSSVGMDMKRAKVKMELKNASSITMDMKRAKVKMELKNVNSEGTIQ